MAAVGVGGLQRRALDSAGPVDLPARRIVAASGWYLPGRGMVECLVGGATVIGDVTNGPFGARSATTPTCGYGEAGPVTGSVG